MHNFRLSKSTVQLTILRILSSSGCGAQREVKIEQRGLTSHIRKEEDRDIYSIRLWSGKVE